MRDAAQGLHHLVRHARRFPLPTIDGVKAVAQASADVGIRAALAPMMADRSFFEAIPGLADALPGPLREQAPSIKHASHAHNVAICRELFTNWKFDRTQIRPALGPTIPTTAATSS